MTRLPAQNFIRLRLIRLRHKTVAVVEVHDVVVETDNVKARLPRLVQCLRAGIARHNHAVEFHLAVFGENAAKASQRGAHLLKSVRAQVAFDFDDVRFVAAAVDQAVCAKLDELTPKALVSAGHEVLNAEAFEEEFSYQWQPQTIGKAIEFIAQTADLSPQFFELFVGLFSRCAVILIQCLTPADCGFLGSGNLRFQCFKALFYGFCSSVGGFLRGSKLVFECLGAENTLRHKSA
jgi:hypothetical protein